MLRRSMVSGIAVLVIAMVAGAATAAGKTGTAGDERGAGEIREATTTVQQRADARPDRDEDERADGAAEARHAAGDVDDDSGFGAVRAAEVAAFHDCAREADDTTDDAEAACEKPGPAWQSDAHPVFGDDGAKAGRRPGEHAQGRASERSHSSGRAKGGPGSR